VIEQARLFATGETLDAAEIEPHLPLDVSDLDLRRRTRVLERQLFAEALRRAGGRKAEASKLLGIDPSNWAYHAKRLDL
jgi:transcriptional regulator with GAF, ATPase, and Fis domain